MRLSGVALKRTTSLLEQGCSGEQLVHLFSFSPHERTTSTLVLSGVALKRTTSTVVLTSQENNFYSSSHFTREQLLHLFSVAWPSREQLLQLFSLHKRITSTVLLTSQENNFYTCSQGHGRGPHPPLRGFFFYLSVGGRGGGQMQPLCIRYVPYIKGQMQPLCIRYVPEAKETYYRGKRDLV